MPFVNQEHHMKQLLSSHSLNQISIEMVARVTNGQG